MKDSTHLCLTLLVAALLPFAAAQAQTSCASGSSCIAPQRSGYERPTTNNTQDVIVPGASIVERVQNLSGSQGCSVAGASECVRPMQGGYAVVPYPTAIETVVQPSNGAPAVANWLTTNAVAAQMTCGNGVTTLWSGAVSPSGTNVAIPTSMTWPSGTYSCSLVATNTLSRQASATSTFLMTNGYPMPFGAPQDATDFDFGYCNMTLMAWDQPTLTAHFYLLGNPGVVTGLGVYPSTPQNIEMRRRYTWNSVIGTWVWASDTVVRTRVIASVAVCGPS